ncbi:hypothetical protein [Hyphomicrobium sp.]|uniref:hypothetical protein n=1 Tax=Hyphomicrobium sp. TaxID=82 RepID=UPI0025B8FF9E|nr:hypothetical protein [Hyphomicrobium sp.]MCC7252483.1 hypothetical protein [Hyphomicrobium sp.]
MLIVDSVDERQRAIAAACKIVSFCAGAILGGGVMVAVTETIGWTGIFLGLASLGAVAALSVIFLGGMERGAGARAPFSLRNLAKRPRFLKRIGLDCLLFK